jgi:uncharacterized protein (TIGR02453 family)
MIYFSQDYIDFFKELSLNNEKSWFDENRKRYEESVKKPFQKFVNDLNQAIQHFDKNIDTDTKKAIFRINRDIRFSKDKTPYNTVMKAAFTNGGRKSSKPAYYLGISYDHFGVGAGSFDLEKDALEKLRLAIAKKTDSFLSVINDKKLKSSFSEVHGERLKKAPKCYEETFEKCPIIANKQFYLMNQFPAIELILKDDFLDLVISEFEKAKSFNQFLLEAIV